MRRTGRRTMWLFGVVAAVVQGCGTPAPAGGGLDAGGAAGVDGGAGAAVDAGSTSGADGRVDGGFDGGAGADAGGGGAADAGVQKLGWANLQWPPWGTVAAAGTGGGSGSGSGDERLAVYGQVWMEGVTSQPGAGVGVQAEAGVGPVGTMPWEPGWTWTEAAFNVDSGNNDEFTAQLPAVAAGTHDYAFRFRFEDGPWLYADRSDGGREGALDGYQPANAGKLSARTSGATLKVVTLNLHCLSDAPKERLDVAAMRLVALGVDVVALQEVCEDPAPGAVVANSAAYLAQQLGAASGRPFHHHFAQTHLFQNTFPEGVGIVSALPLAHAFVADLPVGDFPRKAQVLVLATPVGTAAVASIHYSFRQEDAQARLEQAQATVAALDALTPQVTVKVIAGDFNTVPGTPPVNAVTSAGYVDAWAATHPTVPGFTHRADNPTRRIDYVFFAGSSVQAAAASLEFTSPYAPSKWVSDHIGVATELRAP